MKPAHLLPLTPSHLRTWQRFRESSCWGKHITRKVLVEPQEEKFNQNREIKNKIVPCVEFLCSTPLSSHLLLCAVKEGREPSPTALPLISGFLLFSPLPSDLIYQGSRLFSSSLFPVRNQHNRTHAQRSFSHSKCPLCEDSGLVLANPCL